MFRIVRFAIPSQVLDPYNNTHKRNINNTPKMSYNCAGYALGCYSWYCPRKRDMGGDESYGFETSSRARQATNYSVKIMLADFPNLRVVNSLDEIHKDETAILFRHSSDGDFHFLKRGQNGRWYHKTGRCESIYTMPKEKIFSVWEMRYDGPIVIMAMKREAD